LFYKQVMTKAGWSYYSVINLQYKGQVVAKRRGAEDVSADSLRTLQVMQMIAINSEKQAGDSLQTMLQDNDKNTVDSNMIQHSIQRDENGGAIVDSSRRPKPVEGNKTREQRRIRN